MTTVNSNATPMLLASGERERVILQIATISIQRLDGSVTITARVLLDRASRRTFMTDHLARELKLLSNYNELLSLSTFGAEKASNVDTYVVQFRVKMKDGSHMLISGGSRGGTGGTCPPPSYFLIHYLIAIYNLDSKLVTHGQLTI